MFRLLAFLLPVTFLSVSLRAAPEIPGEPQRRPIAIVNATLHPVASPTVDGTLVFDGGRIVALGKNVAVPAEAEVIDAKGRHVYPGLFSAFSNVGLVEVNSIRGSRDQQEIGQVNPNVRAQVAINPDSELIPVTRSNGVLLSHVVPTGGALAGWSAVVQLDGWTFEDLTLRDRVAMHINWPLMTPVNDWWLEKSPKRQMEERDVALKSLRAAFLDARSYQHARDADPQHPLDARWEGLLPVLRGERPLLVSADEVQQIQAAVAFAREQRVKMILCGGYDAPLCAGLLNAYDIPVIVREVHRLPRRRDDDYDAAYTLPARLRDAGVRFCLTGEGRFGASNARNLPYQAATAVAYGLAPDEALRAITLSPAEILGVADRVGSLAVGKEATLFLATGDVLEVETQIEQAFVQGRRVELNDRHKRLWRKYEEKLRRLEP